MKIRFDEETIARLPPTEKTQNFWDTRQPGLVLRVTPAGGMYFFGVGRPEEGGNPRWLKLGGWPEMPVRDARKACRTALGTILKYTPPAEPEGEPWEDLVELYLKEHVHAVDPRTGEPKLRRPELIEAYVRGHLIDPFRGLRGPEVSRERMVPVLLAAKVRRKNPKFGKQGQVRFIGGPFACRNLYGIAHAMCQWLLDPPLDISLKPLIPSNPVPSDGSKVHGLTKKELERQTILTHGEQIRRVWHAAQEMIETAPPGGALYGKLTHLSLLNAQRKGQFGSLRRDQVEDGKVFFGRDEMKMGVLHILPLTPFTDDILSGLPIINNSAYYFTVHGKVPFGDYSYYKKQLDKISGVTGFTMHDLRRTARTNLSPLTDLHIAELILSHKKQGMLSIYDLYKYLPQMRIALVAWQTKLMQIVQGELDGDLQELMA